MRIFFLMCVCALALNGAQAFNFTMLKNADQYINDIDHNYLGNNSTCGEYLESQNGYIYSHIMKHGSMINLDIEYGDSAAYDCEVTIDVGDGYRALIQFFGNVSVGTGDNFIIYDGDNSSAPILLDVGSGEIHDSEALNASSNFITFKWTTNGDNEAEYGFKAFYSAFRVADECSYDEFSCDVDRCVPDVFTCDGANQCLDKTDEGEDCTVLEKFLGTLLRIGLAGVITILVALILLVVFGIALGVYCCCFRGKKTKVVGVKGDSNV